MPFCTNLDPRFGHFVQSAWLTLSKLVAGLSGLAAGAAFASPPPEFSCDMSSSPGYELVFEGQTYMFGGNLYYPSTGRLAFTAYPVGEDEWWPQVPSASGMKFEKDGITVFLKGDEGFLELPDGSRFDCQKSTEEGV